jgi:hypothetical protein
MKSIHQATHYHKRVGDVVVLQSTPELAQVTTSASDTFWVKLADLTVLAEDGSNRTIKKESRPTRRHR